MAALWFLPLVALFGLAIWRLLKVGSRPAGYPPGPPTVPILGNLHLMPKENGHIQFQKWAQEYGPIYSLILGTKVMIVVSSDQAVKDLFDKRSAIYSSRPETYIAQIVSGRHKVPPAGLRVLLMPYGERWRMAHRIYHNILNIRSAKSFVPYQDLENKQMLDGLLNQPEFFVDHIRRYSHSLTTQMTYGFRSNSMDNPKLKALFTNLHEFSKTMGTTAAALLDLYPPLRHLPDVMLPTRRYAKKLHTIECDLHKSNWMEVKAKLRNGTAKPSLCVSLAKAQDIEGFSDEQAGYIAGNLLEAGADTTSAQLVGFVQAMLLFPEVQKKAQAEIVRVCGDRMPTMDDEMDLQYIRACMKETHRWMPTAILGIAHSVIKDDEYMGYKIPKDSTVVLNVWAIHMDPKRHSNPSVFDPSRYADDYTSSMESAQSKDPSKRDQFLFGAGRRICQGMHIADRSMFLAMSRMLWAFDLRKARDCAGNEITPDPTALIPGMLVQPVPFRASITPRTPHHARVVREQWAGCRELLDEEHQWREVPRGMALDTYEPVGDPEKV
ncbi:Uu.00g098970.m01.CDS01 [Anthostomella pinea]|uniref:Uu.00g098970.m01.CDS01 n=1 Tax=Anthostomella pinea TaxID=933095 RepID=A0AAI8YFB2_9PEZI|nr:Uu.00g098970.m01.CDS01 [Anthostomella pinea]